MEFTRLDQSQIALLTHQGCSARDWQKVAVSPSCDLSRLRNVAFSGTVTIGDTGGTITVDGVECCCGIYDAAIDECTIGSHVRIAKIGTVISRYTIEDDVLIEDAASLTADEDPPCGQGAAIDVVNEAGGRSVLLYTGLSSHTAYLQAIARHDPRLTENLSLLIRTAVLQAREHRAKIGRGTRIVHSGAIRNVTTGEHAQIHGAQYLENGTILSSIDDQAEIGEAVQARSFIIAEGAHIDSGAMIEKVFVGQASRLGKQFSAEHSLFFANCEGYHGEAVSLLAGPYTVTHHKSTLLIAGMFSFYNAGSGTNQSNHMYKLGPVHQGVFERGCKTGSFSYVLLESRVGAFSVLIGKHYTNINTPDLPFSYIHEDEGASKLIPGMTLFSVGTVRDGEKWPKRDNRKSRVKRDLLCFDVFSPYTVEKMRRGRNALLALAESTPKEKPFAVYGGVEINRLLLRKGAKYYQMAIARYLNDSVCTRLSRALDDGRSWSEAVQALASDRLLGHPDEWTDLGGLLTPRERVRALEEKITSGRYRSVEEVDAELRSIYEAYRDDEWRYVYEAFSGEYGTAPDKLTTEGAIAAIEEWKRSAFSLHSMTLEDSTREFAAFARVGYGIDRTEEEAGEDFRAVRGSGETNSVVQKLVRQQAEMEERYQHFKSLVLTTAEGAAL